MENNRLLIFVILLFPFLVSCKKADTVISAKEPVNYQVSSGPVHITDSLFIGEPLAKDPEFIRNTERGGENFQYFNQFGNLLKKHNKKYVDFKSNAVIKTLKISDKLVLELKRKKFAAKSKTSDIQIVLYTRVNNVIKDSILFYKYQLDKDFPKEQRFETIVFLDNNLELFKLESYCNFSEYAFQADKWEKFKINSSNGKIEFVENLKNSGGSNLNNNTEAAAMVLVSDAKQKSIDISEWEGKYTISIDGDRLSDGSVSGRTWNFSITEYTIILETSSYHEPIFCEGNYIYEFKNSILDLYYIGLVENCKSSAPNFRIKRDGDNYCISSPDFYDEKEGEWHKLIKE
ncbi:hypothetical protein NAT51_07250 [Flavobacterium amniphilum]|uniref:hypothetical protein n=1 Tax=Flavobacterium amniphilum TaxID=1834035 RepID=UPI00202A1044|nr:hypothetical protein [Flavobacterium amniphilum]MCL9805311.1 hypothetical protein [Flavobacterium amniphilum]